MPSSVGCQHDESLEIPKAEVSSGLGLGAGDGILTLFSVIEQLWLIPIDEILGDFKRNVLDSDGPRDG